MPSEDVQTNLRLPADLKERLVEAATNNKRSLSAEVASRLEESFMHPKDRLPGTPEEINAFVEGIVEGLVARGWGPEGKGRAQ